jgi:hypothetical protein
MAKGFHSVMSITDGGVFDINNVLVYKKKSLNLLEGLHRDILSENTGNNRHKFCHKHPLMGFELDFNKPECYKLMLEKMGIVPDSDNGKNKKTCLNIIDKKGWEHLASIFDIDIFKFNQFEFETKEVYTKLIIHSKVDYFLEKPNDGGFTIAFRGMAKVWDSVKNKKVINPLALDLFKAIENDAPIKVEIDTTELLSLSDYQIKIKGDANYPLLPHDSVSCKKVFYSHSPRGCRVSSLTELNRLNKRYDVSKKSENPVEVSKVKKWGEKLSD